MLPKRLRFDEIAAGRDFHAALAADFPRRGDAQMHTHDFSEAFYVLEGTGQHDIDGQEETLRAGDLRWIRPNDCHTFSVRPGQRMRFINIAFRQTLWEEFRALALERRAEAAWETASFPTALHVSPEHRGQCASIFQETLRRFHTYPTRLVLCRFWTEILLLIDSSSFLPTPDLAAEAAWPHWLSRACLAMQSPQALKAGVPRFAALCGVSPAHLGRTLKAHTGQTPTEFINARRLEHAAILLATTTEEIGSIADECGFENLSYFYLLFGRRYGQSPRRYRLEARQAVMP